MGLAGLFAGRAPAAARLPSSYKIEQFIADSNGVDDTSTSTVTMLHNLDSVTVTNPFPNTRANFTIKTVTQEKTKLLTGTIKVETKQKTEDFSLAPGETRNISLAEGSATFAWTGTTVNEDIYVTLVSVDVLDDDGDTSTVYTGAGQNIFGFDIQRQIANIRNVGPLKRLRGGKAVIMGVGPRRGPVALARPPAGGAGRGGDYSGPAGGASSAASYGIMGRIRPY